MKRGSLFIIEVHPKLHLLKSFSLSNRYLHSLKEMAPRTCGCGVGTTAAVVTAATAATGLLFDASICNA